MIAQTTATGLPGQPGVPTRILGPNSSPIDNKKKRFWTTVWIFAAFLCVHLFIFRGVLAQMPDLLAGRAVLNTSELVPFFDPSAQFFEQAGGAFSDLTNAYEFRVRYSLLTTWMRYYLILPFAIVLVPFFGAFFVFLVVNNFLRRLFPSIPAGRIIHATAITTLFIHLILLPAKITHFYTLILGFDIFVISFVLFLHGLLLESRRPALLLLVASLVALVNPAVHFLVLYPLTVVFFCAGTGILLLITGGKHKGAGTADDPERRQAISFLLWKRIVLALLFTALITLLPYALFVKFYVLRGVGNLSDIVPDTVASIRISSLSLLHQISFDISSVTENFFSGSYITQTPQYSKLFYFLIALIPFVIPVSQNIQEKRRLRPLLILICILTLFSMWTSIGYADVVFFPTFHMLLAAVYRQFYLSPSHAAEVGMKLITEVIHVLRFPDRFQFIFLAAMTLLMPMGVIVLERECSSRIAPHLRLGRMLGTLICASIFFFPLFAQHGYRTVLLTGDFGGFLRPYNVQPLREIKEALRPLPKGKLVILPPSEGPWLGETADGQEYRFIDKFFIYFLNSPSYYFGLNGDLESKYWFYLLFQSLSKNEHGWVNIFRNLNIRYLVLNKQLASPKRSAWYMQSISQSLMLQPQAMPRFFRKIKENEGFVLYEFIDPPQSVTTPIFMDAGWDSFRCVQERSLTVSRRNHLLSLDSMRLKADGSALDVLAGDKQKTLLDLYAKEHEHLFFRPDQSSFAFMEEHTPSSQYFGTVFPMLNLLTASAYNIYQIMMPGPYDTLTTSFVGLIKPTALRFPLTVSRNGTYEILLRSIPTQHNLAMRLDRGPVSSVTTAPENSSTRYMTVESAAFGKQSFADISRISSDILGSMIPQKIMPTGDQFEYMHLGTMDLSEGQHVLFLHKNDSNPIVIEGILLLPVQKQAASIPLETDVRFVSPDSLNE
ncbi:MAG: hypothetical protein Q7S29_05200 [Candidatus Peribacter sp.]|nr:hypothetical protein [Candidatus Peribacter sp.]